MIAPELRRRLGPGCVGLLTLALFGAGQLAPHAESAAPGHDEHSHFVVEAAAVHAGDTAHYDAPAGRHATHCGACLTAARKVGAQPDPLVVLGALAAVLIAPVPQDMPSGAQVVPPAPGRAPPAA